MVAPPLEPVPPPRYGGTERVVATLASGLHARGHDVTLFAAGDSVVPCRLVPTVPHSLWSEGFAGDVGPYMESTIAAVAAREREFDIVHSHIDVHGFAYADRARVPVITTPHLRLDRPAVVEMLGRFPNAALVAISDSQRSLLPTANWVGTIHHGMSFDGVRLGAGDGGYLAFVGRIATEKGIADAIELARRSGLRLRIAAKAFESREVELYETLVKPAEREGTVEFLGEVDPPARDELLGGAVASLMLGRWPEPFGLAALESLAVGTPVICRHAGALPEIIRHGRDGFIVDTIEDAESALGQVAKLDRAAIQRSARRRFSAERMVHDYEQLYRRVIDGWSGRNEPRCTVMSTRAV